MLFVVVVVVAAFLQLEPSLVVCHGRLLGVGLLMAMDICTVLDAMLTDLLQIAHVRVVQGDRNALNAFPTEPPHEWFQAPLFRVTFVLPEPLQLDELGFVFELQARLLDDFDVCRALLQPQGP